MKTTNENKTTPVTITMTTKAPAAAAALRRTLLLVLAAISVQLLDKRSLAWAASFIIHGRPVPQQQQQQQQKRRQNFPLVTHRHRRRQQRDALAMVRNIDLPECLVIYGSALLTKLKDDKGLISLLQECKDTGTGVIAIVDDDEEDPESILKMLSTTSSHSKTATNNIIIPRVATRPAPNPRDLHEAIQSIIIQPRPFGGSAGFGSKSPDPERCPLPARTVVLCTSLDETRAARYCGMRVICFFNDNALADAIMDDSCIDFYLDDIATPGSFWLNPPHPRDDDGNRVPDIETLMQQFEQQQQKQQRRQPQQDVDDHSNMKSNDNDFWGGDNDDIDRILADLAPL
jgi:hypothetical protein